MKGVINICLFFMDLFCVVGVTFILPAILMADKVGFVIFGICLSLIAPKVIHVSVLFLSEVYKGNRGYGE